MSETEANGPEPSSAGPTKAEKLAAEALESARAALDNDTGRKVSEAAATAFEKAEAVTREALESETGRKVVEAAEAVVESVTAMARQAADSEAGRKAQAAVSRALDNDAGRRFQDAAQETATTGKQWLATDVGRNVGVGAAIGAAVGLVPILPLSLFSGALLGGALGFARLVTKKPKQP